MLPPSLNSIARVAQLFNPAMNKAFLQGKMLLATMAMFIAALWINDELFRRLEFLPGINWVYMPAGVRLVATLLFGEAGAVGLLLISWWVSFRYFFPQDFTRAFVGGILATVAPYGVYLLAQRVMGLRTSLVNLTPAKLLVCALACSLANPLLHHIWFYVHGQREGLVSGFLVMFAGDFSGTLIVLYAGKWLASFLQALAARKQDPLGL
jgi:hypothetical protein